MRFRKILRSPTSTNHSLNARSPLGFPITRDLLIDPIDVFHLGYVGLDAHAPLPEPIGCSIQFSFLPPCDVDKSAFSNQFLRRRQPDPDATPGHKCHFPRQCSHLLLLFLHQARNCIFHKNIGLQFLNAIARSNELVPGSRRARFVAKRSHLGESCRTPRLNPVSGRGYGIAEAL